MSPPPFWLAALLLWLAGNALRLTILAVPPVLPDIHRDLSLTATEVGILGGLPVALFAFAALPGSLLIARLGAVRALLAGLLLTAIGGALRGALPNVAWLYAMSIVTGAGVAVMQPALPDLVRRWAPGRIGFATALYTNGLLIGEIIPVVLSIPVIMPLVGTWQLELATWSLPVLAIAVLVLATVPAHDAPGTQRHTLAPKLWWPDWRDPLGWRLGLIFGGVTSMYFGGNTFLPDYLTSHGRADLISAALTAINFGQLPASLLLLPLAGRIEGRIWPYAVFGLVAVAGTLTIAFTANAWTVVGAAAIGFACAGVLVLTLALPPLLCARADVARTSAAMLTIAYALAMAVAVIGGVLWDLTGIPSMAFVPICLAALLPLTLPTTLPLAGRGEGA